MSKKKSSPAASPVETHRFGSTSEEWRVYAVLSLATAVAYYFSNLRPQSYYDYTFRVAANMLGGQVAFTEKQPSWLNEFVPFEGFYYSVFPLGSVVSMMPFALLKVVGWINEMPAAFISSNSEK